MSSYTSTSREVETQFSLKALLRRHPIAGYFVLAYGGTWLTLAPALLSKSGISKLQVADRAHAILLARDAGLG